MKIAILTDIHEDIISLELAFQKISRQKCDVVVCLGDISGFNVRFHQFIDHRNASACLQLLSEKNAIIVAGNHDLHSCGRLPFMAGDDEIPENWFQLDHATRLKIAGNKVWHYTDELDPLYTAADIQKLRDLPLYYSLQDEDISMLFSHYLYPNLNGFKKELHEHTESFLKHTEFMQQKQCLISFCGHAHTSGMMHFNKSLHRKSFNKRIKLEPNNIVMIPPVVRNKTASGFCIFDTKNRTAIALRI